MPKISALPSHSTLTASATIPVVSGGVTYKTTLDMLSGAVNLLWYIPQTEHAAILAGTSTYDCLAAMNSAIASVTSNITSQNRGGPIVFIPPGIYYFSDTIELQKTVIIEGAGVGHSNSPSPTKLTWPAGKTGIRVNRHNTYGGAYLTPSSYGADASIIRNLWLQGTLDGGAATAHGIHSAARVTIDQCRISAFNGNGIHINATSGAANANEGNANNFSIMDCRITGCNHGLYVDGADANAGLITHIDCSSNRQWGIWDSSFLGNTYIAPHMNQNWSASAVSDGVNRYICIADGTVGVAPGSDATKWFLHSAGGVNSIFVAYNAGTTYNGGGDFKTDNANAQNVAINMYVEGAGPVELAGISTILGGNVTGSNITANSTGTYSYHRAAGFAFDKLSIFNYSSSVSPVPELKLMASPGNGDIISYENGTYGVSPWRLKASNTTGGQLEFDYANSSSNRVFAIPMTNTTRAYGRSAGEPYSFFVSKLFLGSSLSGTGSQDNARQITFSTAAPTSGNWAQGDRVFNINATNGSASGWVCTVSGTPGTWRPVMPLNTVSADKGDAAATLTAGTSETTNQWNTALTADRAVTLSTTGAWNGSRFRIVRTAASTGAFNLNVGTGPLKALATGTWCDVEYNGSAWMLTAYGAL